METDRAGDNGRTTTRLGYGCSSLMGALGQKESLALLEAAYDAGVRHFDVAPLYGFGQAEGCLGEFLARHRGRGDGDDQVRNSAGRRIRGWSGLRGRWRGRW